MHAHVTRVIPQEDGARLELELEQRRVYITVPLPTPGLGEEVRVRIEGGARFADPDAV